ncbi:MAG: hypothetical protein AAB658_10725, partial [Chloroflexota bacterium]
MVITIASAGLVIANRPRASAAITAQTTSPIELAIYPDKLWQPGNSKTGLVIGVRGLNGFSGSATVNVTGLPVASGDGIDGYVSCESNCGLAGVGTGKPPYTVPVVADQWKMFTPGLSAPIDSTTEYTTQTYQLTVTASVTGYSSVTKTATLLAEHTYDPPANGSLTPTR